MRVTVFDTETTTQNRGPDSIGKFSASPWSTKNRMVSLGALKGEMNPQTCKVNWSGYGDVAEYGDIGCADHNLQWLEGTELLTGHNIRFDMWYARKTWGDQFDAWTHTGRIWDTQLAEFLLEGGTPTPVTRPDGSPVLDAVGEVAGNLTLQALSVKYGGDGKSDEISLMIKQGACPGDLIRTHRAELLHYMKQDVYETARVFLGQLRRAMEMGMLPFIMEQMEGLLATYEMGWNGAVFDKNSAQGVVEHLNGKCVELEEDVAAIYKELLPDIPLPTLMSAQLLSKVLFGGVITYKMPRPVLDDDGNTVLYKSGLKKGEVKTRMEEVQYKVKQMIKPLPKWKTKREGIYQTNDDVLAEVQTWELSSDARRLVETVLAYRDLDKKRSTYFIGYSDLCWPTSLPVPEGCGLIHSSLNHTVVPTARLSSSSPNLQNLPK